MTSASKENFRSSKSYVLRNGRITKAQLKAITSLKKNYILQVNEKPLDFSKVFEKPENPLIADVGFGSGESLLSLAEKNQDANIVGIEVYLSGIGIVLNQIKERGITNLKIIYHDVATLFKNHIPDETFDYLIFLYPDPWPKRKHHKRRLLRKEFIELSYKKLKPAGVIYCKTDWENHFLNLKKEFYSQRKWLEQNQNALPFVLKNLSKTRYENKAIKEGRSSLALFYRKG